MPSPPRSPRRLLGKQAAGRPLGTALCRGGHCSGNARVPGRVQPRLLAAPSQSRPERLGQPLASGAVSWHRRPTPGPAPAVSGSLFPTLQIHEVVWSRP